MEGCEKKKTRWMVVTGDLCLKMNSSSGVCGGGDTVILRSVALPLII